MACLLFTKAAGVKPALLAYRGTGPAMNDLIGGHVDFFCEQAVSVASQVKGGSIRAYAVSSSERRAALPDVPTAQRAGLSYQMNIWPAFLRPKARRNQSSQSLLSRSTKPLTTRASGSV